jgi:hypothetical protein
MPMQLMINSIGFTGSVLFVIPACPESCCLMTPDNRD